MQHPHRKQVITCQSPPSKKKSSLSRAAAKISNRGNRRFSDQLTLTSLWGAQRASQREMSTLQQTNSVSTSGHIDQLQQLSLNAHRNTESPLSSTPRISTQSPIRNTNVAADGQVTITVTSQPTNNEAPAVGDDGSQPPLFLSKALHLSPALAKAVCPTQSPLILDSPHIDSEPNPTNECHPYRIWIAHDTTSQSLFCTAKERIKDCPPNDLLVELRSLLDGGASVSLDTFRTALEELCNKRSPATWKPTKHRY
ncbi:hypothetical protein PHET_12397 [Paragonimus heterotremus]|uniref:Uncharacterized protein n=1 Tax=Paragonimus heterotremus TaxID=100268 RepID=A0A8J4WLW9_9TREM|nr:hypothetical protein PHET_12397 [Paragonimus heterotremus]